MCQIVAGALPQFDTMRERLTKYECSRIIGIRASQIAMSAPILVHVPPNMNQNLLYIAALELKNKKLDLIIRRPLPLGKFYEVHISELELNDDLDAFIHMFEEQQNRNA